MADYYLQQGQRQQSDLEQKLVSYINTPASCRGQRPTFPARIPSADRAHRAPRVTKHFSCWVLKNRLFFQICPQNVDVRSQCNRADS